ncbi:hypothetical protein [Microbacterium sp.]|jgi:hypothetical protein|uniref:hypothetical protein n=1 Tax=Microbacterium sp. TaxID=51671 RepID=UPI0026251321|nr:hypothetical protein [Microbacterium sp.]
MRTAAFAAATRVRTLASDQDEVLGKLMSEAVVVCGATNVFNPSVAAIGDTLLVAFRGESFRGERPFHSWLVEASAAGTIARIVDLTDAARDAGLSVVADPKLLSLGEEVYVTFNSGYTQSGPNAIYLQKVFPELRDPQECKLEDRQRIEKNWAFYLGDQGDLCALYGIAPLQKLTMRAGNLGSNLPLGFTRDGRNSGSGMNSMYTIGTQLHLSSDGAMQFVVHQKHRVMHKRAYTGRLARMSLDEEPAVRLSSTRLIHSYAAALPQLRPHNRRLISATYFSGITAHSGDLLLSYGINDRTFGIARVPQAELWTEGSLR